MTGTARADQELVRRGLARSRAVAGTLIRAGRVTCDGRVVAKPSTAVAAAADLAVIGAQDPWVGRAAYKLLHALERFDRVDPAGARCIDVGASTGGFTQVLLSRAAREVVALDVGHDQLAPALRADPRVQVIDGANIRDVLPAGSPVPADSRPVLLEPGDCVVSDLSFISLRLVLDRLAALLRPDGDLIVLIKPQFEVGRGRLGHDGVVHSPQQRREAVESVLAALGPCGLHAFGLTPSPVLGGSGNQEYLLWARRRPDGKMSSVRIADLLEPIGNPR